MSLVLKINTVDRTDHVKWDTLVKTDVLSKEVDRMEFQIIKTPSKTIPNVNDEVVLEEDSIKIFGGVITERNEVIKGGLLVAYDIRCKDYSQYLDRKVVVKSYASSSARTIVLDLISTYTSGFTTTNVPASTPTVGSIKFNYEQVTRCLTQLADQIGWDWYVDHDKDIHFFDSESLSAPFELTDTGDTFDWESLEVNKTITQIKNSVFVRGGEYKKTISEANAQDIFVANGTQRVFPLSYKYDNITVKDNSTVNSIGTDQQTDPASVDVLYNFNEKFIKYTVAPTSGHTIKVFGDAYIPIIAQVRDQISISTYGEYQAAVVDKSITSINEAQTRAQTELKKYSESVYEATFKTTQTGLKVGQKIRVNSAIRGIDKFFKINKIIGKVRDGNSMIYSVFLIASGQVSFTDIMVDLLSKDKKNILIATNEVLQRLEIFSETASVADAISGSATTGPYKWGPDTDELVWGFGTWG